jgi:cell division septation protein DedD
MRPRRLLAVIALVVAVAITPSAFGTSAVTTGAVTGSVSLVDQSWYCRGPVNLSSVTVVIRTAQTDAIHLAAGCTGTIGKVTVVQYHGDGIIVGPGAHDLKIGGGSIRCYAHDPGKHQDGIQAMGGQRVTFTGLDDECMSANNSAMFVNEGGNHVQLPSDIVCVSCYLAGGGFPVRVAVSLRSGLRNSRICAGKFGFMRISPGVAQSPVNVGTVVVTPGSAACPVQGRRPTAPPPTTTTTTTQTTTTSTTEPKRHKHRHHDSG